MKTKHALTLDDCHKMLAASEAHAKKNNWAVCIAIVDDGGHLLAFSRLDGCAVASVAIAQGKAHSAAIRKRPTKQDEDLIANGRISSITRQQAFHSHVFNDPSQTLHKVLFARMSCGVH